MSSLVDVTVLLAAADPTSHGHEACRSLLEGLWKGRETWYLTADIENDLSRHGASAKMLERLRRSSSLRMLVKTRAHRSVMDWVLKAFQGLQGEDLWYVEVAALMREHGVTRIYTIDERFRMFPFLEVVNPLRPHE